MSIYDTARLLQAVHNLEHAMRDGSCRPWIRCDAWYDADVMVGDFEYRMARTEAKLNYVPVVLPVERVGGLGRMEFHNRDIYYGTTGKSAMLTPPVTNNWIN